MRDFYVENHSSTRPHTLTLKCMKVLQIQPTKRSVKVFEFLVLGENPPSSITCAHFHKTRHVFHEDRKGLMPYFATRKRNVTHSFYHLLSLSFLDTDDDAPVLCIVEMNDFLCLFCIIFLVKLWLLMIINVGKGTQHTQTQMNKQKMIKNGLLQL